MNGANSYNICPRCGNSNSLSAKYCSRCGGQLKVPEEPVVCHKCHTHNSPMANYCRNCGTELKVGWETKICPKCGKEVDAHDNVCACGYSFVTLQQAAPAKLPELQQQSDAKDHGKKVYNTKGGRGWAITALVFLLLFAYYILAPMHLGAIKTLRIAALNNLDKGILVNSGSDILWYGGNFLYALIFARQQLSVAKMILAGLVAVAALTMVVQLVLLVVRIITGKRNKHIGWFYLAMALLTACIMGLLVLFNKIEFQSGLIVTIAKAFKMTDATLGFVGWAIPVYYLFFFLLSLCSRARVLKEQK